MTDYLATIQSYNDPTLGLLMVWIWSYDGRCPSFCDHMTWALSNMAMFMVCGVPQLHDCILWLLSKTSTSDFQQKHAHHELLVRLTISDSHNDHSDLLNGYCKTPNTGSSHDQPIFTIIKLTPLVRAINQGLPVHFVILSWWMSLAVKLYSGM